MLRVILAVSLLTQFTFAIIFFNEVAHHANPKHVNVSLILTRGSNNESVFNFAATTKTELTKLMGTFSLHFPIHEKDLDYQKEMTKSTLNMCKLQQGVRANFLTKMLMENFDNCSNFRLECPLPQGTFTLTNFTMTDSAVPNYLIPEDLKFLLMLKTQGKFPQYKALEYLYTLKFYGELVKG